jgi:hypothetical protein
MSIEQRVRGRNLSASDLEAFGKTAARLSETSGLSLTEAMVRTLENESLNAQQVRRAVEHCNIAAVNNKYAQLKGDSRIVHIDGGPADPVTVIDALHASVSAPARKVAALEYSTAPSYQRPYTKVASAVDVDLPGLQRRLALAHDELVDMCSGIEFRMETKFAELRDGALRAAREGASLCDLATAWTQLDPAIAKVAMHQLRAEIPWGTKTASLRVSSEHPGVRAFVEFAKVAAEYHRTAQARLHVETQLAEVAGFLGRRVS